jgi:hypothetical protein
VRTRRALSDGPRDWQPHAWGFGHFLKPECALAARSPLGGCAGASHELACSQPTVESARSHRLLEAAAFKLNAVRLTGQALRAKEIKPNAPKSSPPCDSVVTNSLLSVARARRGAEIILSGNDT